MGDLEEIRRAAEAVKNQTKVAAPAAPSDSKIMAVRAREIFDSRGNPTVEVTDH